MHRFLLEVLEMRRRAPEGSVSRWLADRCLELGLQEAAANDEVFPVLSAGEMSELAVMIITYGP